MLWTRNVFMPVLGGIPLKGLYQVKAAKLPIMAAIALRLLGLVSAARIRIFAASRVTQLISTPHSLSITRASQSGVSFYKATLGGKDAS